MVHPTAIVHPDARLGSGVSVGPYAIIDANVTVGAECVIGPYVYLTGWTTIGARNHFHASSMIGDAPQDLKYKGEPTRLRIGDDNVFREHATVHRSAKLEEDTVIGSHNFIMANTHVGHNCSLGDHVIMANGALLGGHVSVDDRAFLSANCIVHQFVRIGTLSLMQGGSAISKDLPPYTIARGPNGICGLNVVGLRRAGIGATERLQLKRLYHLLFRSGQNLRPAVAQARKEFTSPAAVTLIEFVAATKRGICSDTGTLRAGSEVETGE
jgi:UDP-N-acetylglucosamine acyltransferase